MSTKTMRLPPRRVLTADKPRINGENPDAVKRLTSTKPWPWNSTPAQAGSPRAACQPAWSNRLLAGYLAHEFLTNRTLFGEAWEPPARAAEPMKRERAAEPPPMEEKRRRYVEICHLLKADETHLPGVVNPSQIAGILKF